MGRKKLEIARHEAGHAVMALMNNQELQIVSLREMDSSKGADKYLGFTKLEPFDPKTKFTINEAIRRVKISLGGYASEILFSSDGSIKIGCDDLTSAVKWTEGMMQSEDFRSWAARLPVPPPGALAMIEEPAVRAFIDYQLNLCVEELAPFKRAIQLVAEKLYETDELTGSEVTALLSSSMPPIKT